MNLIDCPNCEATMNQGESCPECDHTDDDPDCECATCNTMIYCHACSVAGGADRAIYHCPPECQEKGA